MRKYLLSSPGGDVIAITDNDCNASLSGINTNAGQVIIANSDVSEIILDGNAGNDCVVVALWRIHS